MPKEAVGVIIPPSSGGIVIASLVASGFPQADVAAIFSYDVGSSPQLISLILGNKVTNQGTATLTGTTGTDGRVNYAVDGSGNIYIENRYQGTADRQFSLTFINSYRGIN